MVVLTLVAFAWKRVWRDRDRLRWTVLSQAMLALLLAYGVFLFFVGGHSGSYENVRQFTRADFEFFRSVANDDYGLLVNLVGLYGYWGERIGRFPLATGGAEWWPLTTAVIVGAAILGAWLKRDRAWLLLCGLIGLLLSASTALPGGVDAAVWLVVAPPARLRVPRAAEVERAVAPGPRHPRGRSRRRSRGLAAPHSRRRPPGTLAMVLACALAIAALVPAGTSQIRSLPTIVKPLRYPDYWYKTAAFLERTVPGDERVAVLPWHLYQPLARDRGPAGGQPRTCLLFREAHGATQPRDSGPVHRDRLSLRPNRPCRRPEGAAALARADAAQSGDPLGPRA